MTIYLDYRDGSNELLEPLRAKGLDVGLITLPAGDVELTCKGPDDRPMLVGVEVKKVGEFLTSVYSGRLAEVQLPRLINRFEKKFLLLQGRTRKGDTGFLEVESKWGWYEPKGGRTKFRTYQRMLMSIAMQTPVIVAETEDQDDTVVWIADLAAWCRTPWDGHATLNSLKYEGSQDPDGHLQLAEAPLVRKWARDLDGIGFTKSGEAASYFSTPLELANADEASWARIPGIGKMLSQAIVRQIRSGS